MPDHVTDHPDPAPPDGDERRARVAWAAVAVAGAIGFLVAWAVAAATEKPAQGGLFFSLDDDPVRVGEDLARVVTQLGSVFVVVPMVVVAAAVLVRRRQAVLAVVVLAAPLGAGVLVRIAKVAIARDRPPVAGRLVVAHGYSFPSGHSAQAVACWGVLAWAVTVQRRPGQATAAAWAVAAGVALAVGWSRVFLHVHYLADVVGGWSLSAAWLAALALLTLRRVLAGAGSGPADAAGTGGGGGDGP